MNKRELKLIKAIQNNNYNKVLKVILKVEREKLKGKLKEEFDFNRRDSNGWGAIHYAGKLANLEIIKLLLSRGANIDLLDNKGYRVLSYSCESNQLQLIKFLLVIGRANVNCCDIQKEFDSPLHIAAVNGHLSAVRILLEYGAVMSFVNRQNKTALDFACENNQYQIVNYLLECTNKSIEEEVNIYKDPGKENKSQGLRVTVPQHMINSISSHSATNPHISPMSLYQSSPLRLNQKSNSLSNMFRQTSNQSIHSPQPITMRANINPPANGSYVDSRRQINSYLQQSELYHQQQHQDLTSYPKKFSEPFPPPKSVYFPSSPTAKPPSTPSPTSKFIKKAHTLTRPFQSTFKSDNYLAQHKTLPPTKSCLKQNESTNHYSESSSPSVLRHSSQYDINSINRRQSSADSASANTVTLIIKNQPQYHSDLQLIHNESPKHLCEDLTCLQWIQQLGLSQFWDKFIELGYDSFLALNLATMSELGGICNNHAESVSKLHKAIRLLTIPRLQQLELSRNVEKLLIQIGLQDYQTNFHRRDWTEVDGLPQDFSAEYLSQLGINKPGHVKLILAVIDVLNGDKLPAASSKQGILEGAGNRYSSLPRPYNRYNSTPVVIRQAERSRAGHHPPPLPPRSCSLNDAPSLKLVSTGGDSDKFSTLEDLLCSNGDNEQSHQLRSNSFNKSTTDELEDILSILTNLGRQIDNELKSSTK